MTADEPAGDDLTVILGRLDALAAQLDRIEASQTLVQLAAGQLVQLVPKIAALLDSRPARAIAAWRLPSSTGGNVG